MIDFSKGNEGRFFGGYFGGNIFGAMVRKNPPGRARPLVLLCHGQGTFQTPSLLTYVHLPEFDFITPDCHLLGKNDALDAKIGVDTDEIWPPIVWSSIHPPISSFFPKDIFFGSV